MNANLQVNYGVSNTSFGHCFLAESNEGICELSFYDTLEEKNALIELLHQTWQKAQIQEAPETISLLISTIFKKNSPKIPILLTGTPFQIQVWNALLSLPKGLFCYEEIAELIGKPKAIRAVASAIAKNKIAYLVPCHRIIRKSGDIGQYRWGSERKASMIEFEFLDYALHKHF